METMTLVDQLRAVMTVDENGLLPCPFCNEEAMIGHAPNYVFVNCTHCMTSTDQLLGDQNKYTEQEAVALWNTRTPLEQSKSQWQKVAISGTPGSSVTLSVDYMPYNVEPVTTEPSDAGLVEKIACSIWNINIGCNDSVADFLRNCSESYKEIYKRHAATAIYIAQAPLLERIKSLPSWEIVANTEQEALKFYNQLTALIAENARIMQLYEATKMEHGTCQPRERKACTACNAKDELDQLLADWKGPKITRSALADMRKEG